MDSLQFACLIRIRGMATNHKKSHSRYDNAHQRVLPRNKTAMPKLGWTRPQIKSRKYDGIILFHWAESEQKGSLKSHDEWSLRKKGWYEDKEEAGMRPKQ